jgi:hypothetical protein
MGEVHLMILLVRVIDQFHFMKSINSNNYSQPRLYLLRISSSGIPPNCIDLLVAATTAEIVAARNPLDSTATVM